MCPGSFLKAKIMKRLWVVFFITFALFGAVFPNLAFGQAQPDLLVASDPSGPAQVLNSESYTVAFAIHNAGGDTTRSQFDVSVFMSADSTVQASERVGLVAIADSLAPGDTLVVNVPVQMPALLSLGSYLWIAQVDAQNGIVESDESNNTRVGQVVQLVLPPSDLVVASAPTGGTEVNRNAQYTVTLDLQNLGAGPTQSSFDVTVYLSADAVFDTTDVAVGTTTLSDALSVGTNRTLQISVTIPQTHTLGNFQWLVVLDSGGTEPESNELNNVAVGNAVEVVEKLADLIISSPPSGPNGVFRQGAYTVSTQIRNQGTGENTANFDVVIYLSEDLIVGNSDDVKVGDVAISGTIAVDSTLSVDVPVTISALQGFRAYHWVAVVDDVQFVTELNEDNNALIGHAVSVVPSPSDLAPENLSGPVLVMRNGAYPVSVDVVNSGGGATGGAFQVAFYMSADDSVGNSDDVRVGSTTLKDVLSVGERQTVTTDITMPSSQGFGEYRLLVVVDAAGVEAESDETNNSGFASAPLALVPSPPDILFVTDPVGPERMFRGVVDTVSMQIRNQGSGDVTGEFEVFVFISQDTLFGDDDDMKVGGVRVTEPIVSGQTITVQVPVSVPNDQELGTYRWWATIDAGEVLAESDETNNLRTGVFVSIVQFPADLVIYDVITAPVTVARGGFYDISVPVRNEGAGPAGSGFQVAVYLSTDERLDEDDTLTGGQRYTDALDSGGQQVVTLTVTIPVDQPVANYRWIVRVSTVALQEEVDGSNNVRLGEVVSFPVLAFSPDSLAFGAVRVGETKALIFEVLNGGTAKLSFEMTTHDSQITVSPRSVGDLPAGVRWPVTVTYRPTAGGSFMSTVNISSNGAEDVGLVTLSGIGLMPQTDGAVFDLDPTEGNQNKTSRLGYVGHLVPIDFYVQDLPEVVSARLRIRFDPLKIGAVGENWLVGDVINGATVATIDHLELGVFELVASADGAVLGSGSGLWGQVTLETLDAFRDSSSVLEVIQLTYQLVSGEVDSVQLQSQATLVYDLACWADINADGKINLVDFLFFKDGFDKRETDEGWQVSLEAQPFPQTPFKRFDADGDGVVNLADFVLFTRVFGQSCSP